MIFETKVFLKMPLMFIFTENTKTAENIFTRNCYMFTIGMSSSKKSKLGIFVLLMKKFGSFLSFIFVTILMKMVTIFFFEEKQHWICNFGFVVPYLKEEENPEYISVNEYNGSGIYFP